MYHLHLKPLLKVSHLAILLILFAGPLALLATEPIPNDPNRTPSENNASQERSPSEDKDKNKTPPDEKDRAKPDDKVKGDDKVKADDKAKSDDKAAKEVSPQEAAFNELKERKAREAARKRGEFSFDDLKFEIERGGKFEDSMLPESLKELHKKSMRIRGYILPDSVMQRSGIKRFVLVRDNKECCFGPGAMLYDCIVVEMEEGKTTEFATRPVTVKGTFEIDTKSFQYPDDGGHYAIYKLRAQEAK